MRIRKRSPLIGPSSNDGASIRSRRNAVERSIATWEAEAKWGSTYEQLPALIQVKWHDIRRWRINPSGVSVRKTVLPRSAVITGSPWEVVKESR